MQVDFYQLGDSAVESVLPQLAAKTLAAGQRMLVVSEDDAQLALISDALWAAKDRFLAHGLAGGPHQERQPILLSDMANPGNGAAFVALADGRWRDEALGFERAFLLFGGETIEAARTTWRSLDAREGVERRYWKQEEGRWVQAG